MNAVPSRAHSPIRLLPEATVNRIAAGEVIERPAAAVKELVENALDAGATRIAVTLAGGGAARIEVADDGRGMDAAELALAVLRHATSKLPRDDDLERIETLGFRGEALPSIGAAARLEIVSRARGSDAACRVRVEGGRVEAPAPCAGPPGTRVVVSDLFFATPARRKFLKSARVEAEHAEEAVRRLAFAAPHVAFRLEVDGRVALDLPGQDRAARTAALLGREAVLLPVEGERGPLRVSGFAGAPSVTRATAAGQHLAVNGRPVVDPVLRTAVRVAYRDVIAAGRHPVAALHLEIPAGEVDVNVHPAKTELRYRDPAGVRALVIGALGRALSVGAGAAIPGFTGVAPPAFSGYAHRAAGGVTRPPMRLEPPRWSGAPAGGFAEAALPFGAAPSARAIETPANAEPDHPLGAAVAQVLDTYVIAVAADGALVLVDQHAAHERLTHEALRAQHEAGGVRAQALLLPAVVDLPPADAARLAGHAAALARLGLEIEAFGGGAVLVRAMPAALGAPDPAGLLRDIADELAECGEAVALEAMLDAALARMACHGSIRAGRRLAQAEMDALLRAMERSPRAATCSHGRPTVLKLSRAEIERLFQRR
jgi:DNA mismatch repair protein MutL